jgi:ubiquinone/menaquinone biosynthesis C-methylase UbiE
MRRLRSFVHPIVPGLVHRLLRSASNAAPDVHLDRPNCPEEWEREYLREIRPVVGLAHPIARAVEGLSKRGDLLLEAGCGSGELSAELAHAGRRIELADFSAPILERAAGVFRASGLPAPGLTRCDLTEVPHPWSDRSVDIVWSSGVLEHWTDQELIPIVREMSRVARKRVISLVPNACSVLYRFGKWHAERVGSWAYGREVPRATLRHVFEAAGLSSVREFDVWDAQPADFLEALSKQVRDVAMEWWATLSPEDPVRRGQGYLLLTVGETA